MDLGPLLFSPAEQLGKLRADGLADIGPAWTSRALAIVGGAALLRGRNWARWLLVVWMLAHIGLSIFHSATELLTHSVIFAPLLYLLFRRAIEPYFHPETATPA